MTDTAISSDMVPTVSADQLYLAVERALAATAAGFITVRPGLGPYGSMTGEVAACMAAAIARAFPLDQPADEPLLKGLIWRGIFAFSDVVGDTRFIAFDRSDAQRFEVDRSLMEAVAGIPMPFGGDVPVDAIYASASDANALGLV